MSPGATLVLKSSITRAGSGNCARMHASMCTASRAIPHQGMTEGSARIAVEPQNPDAYQPQPSDE